MTDPQAVAIFLTDALQTGDAGYVGKVLGIAAIAEATGSHTINWRGCSVPVTLRLDALLVIVHALPVRSDFTHADGRARTGTGLLDAVIVKHQVAGAIARAAGPASKGKE
ncbi:helix-turn-helix domain-containing protein [Pseudomonas capsici]|uniref:hypothetical protein n=1 Tax=Pseudomonas capsici TaxID=2810614 RepID=UPI0021F21B3E|nr:hypothetical protein [Pseudomonas capsici]MCV4344084.1 hypothetical protein [Pseudomonas capsici]